VLASHGFKEDEDRRIKHVFSGIRIEEKDKELVPSLNRYKSLRKGFYTAKFRLKFL